MPEGGISAIGDPNASPTRDAANNILPEFIQAIAEATDKAIGKLAGWITLEDIQPKTYSSVSITFRFLNKPGTNFNEHSIRLYYTTTPGQGNADYVDITSENADLWKTSKKDGSVKVQYTLNNLSGGAGTAYYIRVWLRLFKKNGTSVKYSYKSPEAAPMQCYTKAYDRTVPLFEICTWRLLDVEYQGSTYELFEDFTRYIPMGKYDVNMNDVTEDWTDANYLTHKIVTRTKVSGKIDLLFSSKEEYNKFLNIIQINRYIYSSGLVKMRVHLNNQLHYDTDWEEIGIDNLKNASYIGNFYITISSNPWVEPYYGHYDKYSPVSIQIEEA